MRLLPLVLISLLLVASTPVSTQVIQSGGFRDIYDIVIDHEREQIITVGAPIGPEDHNLIIWEVVDNNYQPVYTFRHSEFTQFYSVLLYDNQIYAGASDGMLFQFSYEDESWNLTSTTKISDDNIQDLSLLSIDPVTLVIGDRWSTWIYSEGSTQQEISLGQDFDDRQRQMAYHPLIGEVIIRDFQDSIYGHDPQTGLQVSTYPWSDLFAIHPTQPYIGVIKDDRINITSSTTLNTTIVRPTVEQPGPFGTPTAMQFSPQGQYLVVSYQSSDSAIEIYDTTNTSLIAQLQTPSLPNTIEWVNSYQLYSGDKNGTAMLWDLRTNSSVPLYGGFDTVPADPNLAEEALEALFSNPLQSAITLILFFGTIFLLILLVRYRKDLSQRLLTRSRQTSAEEAELYPDED